MALVSRIEFEALQKRVAAAEIKSGVGYLVRRNIGGTVLEIQKENYDNLTAPFQGFLLEDASDETEFKIRVRLSSLADLAPSGFSPGDSPNFVLDGITASGYVYGKVTIDSSGTITAREILNDSTIPENDSTSFHVEIGSYLVAGDPETLTLAQSRLGPIFLQLCFNRSVEPPVWSALFF